MFINCLNTEIMQVIFSDIVFIRKNILCVFISAYKVIYVSNLILTLTENDILLSRLEGSQTLERKEDRNYDSLHYSMTGASIAVRRLSYATSSMSLLCE